MGPCVRGNAYGTSPLRILGPAVLRNTVRESSPQRRRHHEIQVHHRRRSARDPSAVGVGRVQGGRLRRSQRALELLRDARAACQHHEGMRTRGTRRRRQADHRAPVRDRAVVRGGDLALRHRGGRQQLDHPPPGAGPASPAERPRRQVPRHVRHRGPDADPLRRRHHGRRLHGERTALLLPQGPLRGARDRGPQDLRRAPRGRKDPEGGRDRASLRGRLRQ